MLLKYWYIFVGFVLVLFAWLKNPRTVGSFSSSPSVPDGLSKPKSHYVQMTKNLYYAIKGNGTDIDTIEDVFNSITGKELVYIHKLYQNAYNQTLATHLRQDLENWYFFGNGSTIALVKKIYKESGLQY